MVKNQHFFRHDGQWNRGGEEAPFAVEYYVSGVAKVESAIANVLSEKSGQTAPTDFTIDAGWENYARRLRVIANSGSSEQVVISGKDIQGNDIVEVITPLVSGSNRTVQAFGTHELIVTIPSGVSAAATIGIGVENSLAFPVRPYSTDPKKAVIFLGKGESGVYPDSLEEITSDPVISGFYESGVSFWSFKPETGTTRASSGYYIKYWGRPGG